MAPRGASAVEPVLPSAPTSSPTRFLNRLAALLAALLLLFTLAITSQAWLHAQQTTRERLGAALEVGAQSLDHELRDLEAGLRGLSAEVVTELLAMPAASPVDIARRLSGYRELREDFIAIQVMDAGGQLLARVGPEALPASVQPAPAGAPPEPLPRPVATREGRWVLPIQRPLLAADGRHLGTLMVALPVTHLTNFWRGSPLMDQAIVGLIGDEGVLRGRLPLPPGLPPSALFAQPWTGALIGHLRQAGFPAGGHTQGPDPVSGVPQVYVWARLHEAPVTLFMAVPQSELRAAWWRQVRMPLLLIVLLGLGGLGGWRSTLRQHQAWTDERRLQSESQRFLLDHMLAGVMLHGPQGEVLSVNARARQLLRLDLDAIRDRAPSAAAWHLLDEQGQPLPASRYPIARVLATRAPVTGQVLGVAAPGGQADTWLLANAYPEFDGEHGLTRAVVTFVDISALKQAELTLARSEERFRLLYDNSLDAILQTRPDGRIVAANPAACTLFGLRADQLCERLRDDLVDTSDPRLAQLLDERRRAGRAQGEVTMRRGDGSRFEAALSSSLYSDAHGNEITSLQIRDVTAQRQAEAALQQKSLAEQANLAKNAFVARMSHELRTPLNAVLGFADVMLRDRQQPLTPAQAERVQLMHSAGTHLLALINDLLDLSRIESGDLLMQNDAVDLAEVARGTLLEIAPLAGQGGVEIAFDTPDPALPPVQGDALRLRQVLLNLLSNAIKYNRAGGRVRLQLGRGPAPSTGTGRVGGTGGAVGPACASVRVTVSDTGPGLDAQQLASLFQPFSRLGREASGPPGTGIGLVITRSLVEMMGGRLSVHSRPGEGSEFCVDLVPAASDIMPLDDGMCPPRDNDPGAAAPPAAPGPVDAPEVTPAPPASGTLDHPPDLGAAPAPLPPPMSSPTLQGRLVYIDDDNVNRVLMQAYLGLHPGIDLRIAEDGPTGLAMAAEFHPDVLLIDLMMPGMSGLEVLQAVRAGAVSPPPRCVAVSANAMPDEINEALQAGFDAYITKPLSATRLATELARHLGAGTAPASA